MRRRRSGLRSNRKRIMNTANDDRRLRSIPEEDTLPARDVSSSEKVPKVKLLNDTILEELESPQRIEDDLMEDVASAGDSSIHRAS